MKTRPCTNTKCYARRPNHDRQDEERGQQQVQVPDDYPDTKPYYCSLTCAAEDGVWDARTGFKEPVEEHSRALKAKR